MKKTIFPTARAFFSVFASVLFAAAMVVGCKDRNPVGQHPPPPLVVPDWLDSALVNTSWMRSDPEAGVSMWSFEYKEGDSTGTALFVLTSANWVVSYEAYLWTAPEGGKLYLTNLLNPTEEEAYDYGINGDELTIDGMLYTRSENQSQKSQK
jgi:hypothetical protein